MAYKTHRKSNSLNMPTRDKGGNLPLLPHLLQDGLSREAGGQAVGMRKPESASSWGGDQTWSCFQWWVVIGRLLSETKQTNDRLALNYMSFGTQPGMLSTASILFMASLQSISFCAGGAPTLPPTPSLGTPLPPETWSHVLEAAGSHSSLVLP